jgi:hypothetical protein
MVKLNSQKNNTECRKIIFLKQIFQFLKLEDNVKIGLRLLKVIENGLQFYEGTIIARKIVINTTITMEIFTKGWSGTIF